MTNNISNCVPGIGAVPAGLIAPTSPLPSTTNTNRMTSRIPSSITLSPSRSSSPKPSLSPIRRPMAFKQSSFKLSPKKGVLKASLSTPSLSSGLRRNKISFGDNKTRVFEKEIEDRKHKNECWFSDKEMKTIRKDLKASAQRGDITRGLEHYAAGDMGDANRQKRLDHMFAILSLQHKHKKQQQQVSNDTNGNHSNDHQPEVLEKGLSMMSRAMSLQDNLQARQLASHDSTQALLEYQKELADSVIMKRTSSRNALDNLKKEMIVKSVDLKMNGMPNMNVGAVGKQGNATFGSSADASRRGPKPNLLLQAMDKKKQRGRSKTTRGVAGVA